MQALLYCASDHRAVHILLQYLLEGLQLMPAAHTLSSFDSDPSFPQDDIDSDFDVNNETANRMSLFYAHATPMLKVLSDTTAKFVSDVSPLSHLQCTSFVLGMFPKSPIHNATLALCTIVSPSLNGSS